MPRSTLHERVSKTETRELWQMLVRHADELWALNSYWKSPPERRERARFIHLAVHELANRGVTSRLFDTSELPARSSAHRDPEA